MSNQDEDPELSFLNKRFWKPLIEAIKNHPYRDNLLAIHSALIVKGGSIISMGINLPKSNGFVRSFAPHSCFSVHAEINAIMKARKKTNLTNSKMYVARLLKKDGSLGLSKPCPYCSNVIARYGIKSVSYTTENGYETIRRSEIKEMVI